MPMMRGGATTLATTWLQLMVMPAGGAPQVPMIWTASEPPAAPVGEKRGAHGDRR